MTSEKWEKIKDLFLAAEKISPEKRAEFLDEECDLELRQEVEKLLDADRDDDSFLEDTAIAAVPSLFDENTQKKEHAETRDQIHTTNSDSAKLAEGSVLADRYRILDLLGKGGMGEVYLANDSELHRQVALKILPSNFTGDNERMRRFSQEARAISALNHPNILTIYEIGTADGVHFIATEYIEGETLKELLRNDKLTLETAIDIAVQITMALAAAHQEGIIHRDMKPDNVMIRTDGIVKVLDFGLAKTTSENSWANPDNDSEISQKVMTKPGLIMGTPQYMSPEQARGEKIDSRSDIFSLGMVIYEMITGHPAFIGENSMDMISSILRDTPPPIGKYIENPPPDLEQIIHRTLRKNPAKRFQDIKDLLFDLKQLRDVLTIEENRAKDTDETRLKNTAFSLTGFRQSSAFHPFIFLSLLAVTAGFLWWYVNDLRNSGKLDSSRSSFETVEVTNWKSASGEMFSSAFFSPDGEMVSFDSTKADESGIWIKRTKSGEATRVTKDDYFNKFPLWSPDGEELAYYSFRDNVAGIWRIDIFGGSPKSIAEIKDFGAELRLWSRSGKIYYQSRGNLFAVDAANGETEQVTDFDPAKFPRIRRVSISSDESQVAFLFLKDDNWNIHVKSVAGETDRQVVSTPNVINSLIWHSDGKRLIYSESIEGVYQIFETDPAGGEPVQLSFANRDSHVLDITPDGTRILVGSATENSDLWKVDVKNGDESIVSDEITSEFWPEVSPENDAVVFQAIENLNQGNKLYEGAILIKSLSEAPQTFQLTERGLLPQWSPNGKTIAFLKYTDQKVQIWKIDRTGNGLKRLSGDEGVNGVSYSVSPYNRPETKYISWSPKSDAIAYSVFKDNLSNLWLTYADRTENINLTENEDKNWWLDCPVWHPDGSKIAYNVYSMKRNSKGQRTYQFWFYDFKDKTKRKVFETLERTRLLGWSPNGEGLILAISNIEHEPLSPEVDIYDVPVNTGKKRLTSSLTETYFYNIHLSSDRNTIGFVSNSANIDNIWITPTLGGKMRRLTQHNDPRVYFSSLSWSPDGKFIVFGKQWRFSFLSMITKLKEEKK